MLDMRSRAEIRAKEKGQLLGEAYEDVSESRSSLALLMLFRFLAASLVVLLRIFRHFSRFPIFYFVSPRHTVLFSCVLHFVFRSFSDRRNP